MGDLVAQLLATAPKNTVLYTFPYQLRAGPTYTVVSIMLGVSWFTLALRLWTRAKLVKVFGADDLFMVITACVFTVYCGGAIDIASTVYMKTVLTIGELEYLTDMLIMTEIFYIWTMIFLKISLAVFFLRIMVKTVQRRVVQATVGLSTTVGFMYFWLAVFQCGAPVNGENVLKNMVLDQCLSRPTILGFAYTHASVTLLTDLILALIPIFMLRGSQMPKKEKWVVYFILSLGTVGAVASALRIQYLKQLANIGPTFFGNAHYLTIWSTIEPALGIIAACLATLRKLFGWTGRQLSGFGNTLKSRMTPTHTLTSQNKADPLTSPVDEDSYDLDEVSDITIQQMNAKDIEKTNQWRRDVEMAALPSSTQGSGHRVNEAYG